MNLDDLRSELDARAHDVDARVRGRMAGIRAKAAVRRRRKAGATIAASVLAVGAIIGVPVVNHLAAGPEPADTPERTDDGAPPDISFPATNDSRDPVAISRVGDPGEATLRMPFSVVDLNLSLTHACAYAGHGARSDIRVETSVNGHTLLTGDCASGSEMHFSDDAALNRKRWRDIDARPGRLSTVTVRASAPESSTVSLDGVRLGAAVYTRSAPRTYADGVVLDDCRRWGGAWYELAGYEVADAS